MTRLIATLLLLPLAVLAEPGPWLKKENPYDLHFFAAVETDHCSVSVEDLNHEIQMVFVRSATKRRAGIMPIPYESDSSELFLYLTISCRVYSDSTGVFFHIDVGFGKNVDIGSSNIPVRFFHSGHGIDGRTEASSILSVVRESIEGALSDYRKANFGPEQD